MDGTTAPKDFESLCKTNKVLLCKNKAPCIRSKYLTTDKEALQKRMNYLMGQDTQDTSCVSETTVTDEIDSQEQSTTPEDCESFHRANKFLIQKNKDLRRDIETLQKKINDLISQKTQVTSSVSETSTDTEFADKYLQNEIPEIDSRETQVEAAHGFEELQKMNVMPERVRVLEEWLQSQEAFHFREEQDLRSEPNRLSLLRRFVRLFIPGWRRRYSSRETVECVESGEQARGETQRRPTMWEQFVNFCNRRFRRST